MINTVRVLIVVMDLIEYLEKMGDEKAANLFGVKKRTVMSWRLRERTPRPKQAQIITERSPVTMEGIYGQQERAA